MAEPTDTQGHNGPDDAPVSSHDALAAREQAAPTAILATRRVEMGLSHDDVANQLKFAPRFIEAVEAGDFDKLPGHTFARGMVRNYARLLKVDPAPILAQLGSSGMGRQSARPEEAASMRAPVPFSEGGKHVNLVYTILSIIILALGAFFAFGWYQDIANSARVAFVTPAPEAQSPPPVPAAPAPANVDAQASAPSTFASAGPSPMPETAPRADEKKSDDAAPGPLAPGKRRIVLKFDKESWVEIKTGAGATLLSQLNLAGSEKVVDGDPPFHLTIGNASNVHLTYNDQPVDLKPHFKVDVARLTLN